MPIRQGWMIPIRQRRNRVGALGALAQGVRLAVNNRQAIQAAANAAGKYVKSKFKKRTTTAPKKMTAGPIGYAGGNDYTKSTFRGGAKKPRTTQGKIANNTKLINSMLQRQTFRFQNVSNYDTNLGAITLRNTRDTTSGVVGSPVHIYEITLFPNSGVSAAPGNSYGWGNTTAAAPITRTLLTGQFPNGTTDATGAYNNEEGFRSTAIDLRTAMLNWTQVKLNLYGPRKRTTWFEVMFVQFTNVCANPTYAAFANPEVQSMLQMLERPCIYSNILTDPQNKSRRQIKVLKTFKYYVSSAQSTDVDDSVGKIKEVNIFMRWNKLMQMDSVNKNSVVLPHDDADGADYQIQTVTQNDIEPRKRIYMVIRAFAPERAVAAGDPALDANRDPSYDIVLRNSWSTTKSQLS